MAYRGRDLDLRLPQEYMGRPTGAPEARSADLRGAGHADTAGNESFVVDDTVLACFNHAYDIAAAHRATEVRIAHLLLAATRISETASAMQKRGVHVPGLMRETASIVASQVHVSSDESHGAPRASRELEDVLRHATGYANRQQHPINADDLIDVLFEMKSEVAGIELLDRNAGRVEPRGTSTVRETPRERIRMPQTGSHYGTRHTTRTAMANTPTDTIQNSRLDALEQMVRALGSDLANERRTFSEVLNDLQRDAGPAIPEPPPYVEYEPPLSPPNENYIETTVQQPIYDAGLADRIEALMQELGNLNGRLGKIESVLARYANTGGDMDMAPVVDRLVALEGIIREMQKDRGHDVTDVADRIADLETLISDRGSIDIDLKPVTERLDLIEEAVMNNEGSGADAAKFSADFKALDNRIASQAAMNERLLERFEALSADVVEYRGVLGKSLAEMQKMLAAEIERDREDTSEFVHEVGQVHEALMKLNANQHTLASSIETWRETSANEMSLMAARMDSVAAEAGRPMQMLESMSANMEGMYRATVERYHRRNRLWYWLFGTDDWVTASWPSAAARIEMDRRNLGA